MNFKDYLKTESSKIELKLAEILNEWQKSIENTNTDLIPLVVSFKKSHFGGKMIRGVLCKLGYELASSKLKTQNSKLNREIFKIACAYEIFHTSILAHDDIIDQSILRRGQPSLYQSLGGGHHGISQAICLGDIGFFMSGKIISESSFPDKQKNLALQLFSNTMLDTAVGEMLDVELPNLLREKSEADVVTVMMLKTAKYTVSGPLQLGAILAGASQDLVRLLGEFGDHLGIAFQIQDDILGVFGSEVDTGKSTTSDIAEGKNTLLFVYSLKKANSSQKQVLKKFYGQGKISAKGLIEVKKVFQETGALAYCQSQVNQYTALAKKVMPKNRLLDEMTEYLVKRSK